MNFRSFKSYPNHVSTLCQAFFWFYKMLKSKEIPATKLVGFSDSSWQDCPDTGRSTGGYLIFYNGNLIDAHTSMPVPIAMSSAEAEYMSACNLCMKLAHLRMLVYDLEKLGSKDYDPDGRDDQTPNVVLVDNQAAVTMAKSKKLTSKNRHIRRREHFVRQGEEQGEHSLPGDVQFADIMTKTQDAKKYLTMFTKLFTKISACVDGSKDN